MMTKKEVKGLEIVDGAFEWGKRTLFLVSIVGVMFKLGWTVWAVPKIDKKINPVKEDILYIRLIQEEIVPDSILEKVRRKQERLHLGEI